MKIRLFIFIFISFTAGFLSGISPFLFPKEIYIYTSSNLTLSPHIHKSFKNMGFLLRQSSDPKSSDIYFFSNPLEKNPFSNSNQNLNFEMDLLKDLGIHSDFLTHHSFRKDALPLFWRESSGKIEFLNFYLNHNHRLSDNELLEILKILYTEDVHLDFIEDTNWKSVLSQESSPQIPLNKSAEALRNYSLKSIESEKIIGESF